jgi:hypothetical protein
MTSDHRYRVLETVFSLVAGEVAPLAGALALHAPSVHPCIAASLRKRRVHPPNGGFSEGGGEYEY